MSPKPNTLVVESLIDAPVERVWDRTQNPENHIRWDIRFTQIKYLDTLDKNGFHLLQYQTQIGFGIKITGTGKYLHTQTHEQSTFEFGSEDFKSLITQGKGIWLYKAINGKTYFKSVFDYDTRFGFFGKLIDQYLFRPLFCLATEWGFETLRKWCEEETNDPEKRSSWTQFLLFALNRGLKGRNQNSRTHSWLGNGSPRHSRLLNPDPSNNILLFDGVCNLCNGLVHFVIKRDPDSRFSFASLQSETGRNLLIKYNLPEDDWDTFVFIRNGKAYTQSTAGLFTLKELGGFWQSAFPLILIPKAVRNFFYDLIAACRYRVFGKKDACMTPSPQIKSRFLS